MDISNNDATSSTGAIEGRRKSGRAVKAPEKFTPAAPSSQLGHGNSKRKRDGEHDEDGASDIDESDEDSEEVESAGEEESKEARKKPKSKPARKPAAKKPKVNGTSSHEKSAAVRLPNRPKKAKRAERIALANDTEEQHEEGLYCTYVLI